MVQQVRDENNQIHEFPDDATPEEMNALIDGHHQALASNNFNPSFGEKLAPNLLAGMAEGGQNVLNTPSNIARFMEKSFPEKKNQPQLAKMLGIKASDVPRQDYDYANLLKLPTATLSDQLIRGFGKYAPAFALPEAELGQAGAAISKIPNIGGFLQKGLRLGAPQAGYGAIQEPNDPLKGAGIGLASGFVAPALESGYNALRPSSLFRGNLAGEQLAKNLEETKGTQTGLGRVVESPTLTRLQENILPHIIGSGAEDTMQSNAANISQRGNQLMEKIRGDANASDLGTTLKESLKKAAFDARREKNAGYEKLNKMADESGLKIGRENFQNKAKETLKLIEESPELKNEFNPELLKDIQNYANNSEGNNLKLTNIFRGKLGDKSNEFYTSGKMYEHGILSELKNALSEDIESGFNNSNNKELKEAYQKNQKDYAEKFAPFEDRDIVKFTRQGGDPDVLLSHFLRGGKNDRATLLSKLTEQLNPQQSQLPLYSYLSRAVNENGEISPIKFAQLYRSLGKNQKNALIKDKSLKNQLENYSNLVGKNKESFNLMFNPKTGARNTDLLIKLGQMIGGTAAGGLPGFLATTVGSGLVGRGVNKALTSPNYRESLVNAMIKGKKAQIPGRNSMTGAVNALTNEGNQ